MLEDINSKFNLVLEGHAALDKKFDAKIDALNEKIEQTNFKLGVVNDNLTKRIDALDERLSNRIDELDERLSTKLMPWQPICPSIARTLRRIMGCTA